ncbi:uncharacterized protein LOC113789918 [Dermatophagoides pteronyssinus]|uniref:Uncharacterized protein n=2 Tax=Dermatophagoides pteronyssinus TaxID=6956 RepID=A0ABQ8J614_DERPT|nr:putative uncharacterized protein DDB_G0277255 [Dermatophagoides pteronyssinus]KAH9417969.1 hypothetical protein DERP_008222 [Dermatophagoides pteronyssinus]
MDPKYHYHYWILSSIIVFIWINSLSIDCQAYNGPIYRQVEVFVNVYDHPKTGFSCHDKHPGQYYADPATKCAVYYVCIPNPTGTMSAQSFACPNGTIFSQATRVCRPHEEVFCPLASRYYDSIDGSIDNPSEHVESAVKPVAVPSRPQKFSSHTNKQPKSLPIIASNNNNNNNNNPIPKSAPPSISSSSSSSHGNSFNINRNFRNSRTISSTSTTTSTTTPAPLPLSSSQPSQPSSDLGVADYEYDYSDYNETGLVNAASTLLQSTILNSQQKDSISNRVGNQGNNDHEDDNISNERRRRKRYISLQQQRKEEHMNHKLSESLLAERTKSSESFQIPTEIFSCEDKIHGLAYADLTSDCQRFFVCLSITKGKMIPYRFDCEHGKRFNQQKSGCDSKIDSKTCQRNSKHYYVYNKWFKQSKKHLLNKSI